MLARLFSVRGRLRRLGFLGYSALALAIELLVGAILVFGAIQAGWIDEDGAHAIGKLIVTILLPVLLLNAWFVATLSIQRLHDMGLGGIYAVGVVGLLEVSTVLDFVVDSNSPGILPGVAGVLGVACFVVLLWLLFWPGQREANRFGPAR